MSSFRLYRIPCSSRIAWLLSLLLVVCATVFARQEHVLTNDDVIQMVKAKLSEGLIENQIRNSKTDFDLSTPALIGLSKAGVSDAIIESMRKPGKQISAVPPTAGSGQVVKTPDGEKVQLILQEDVSSATAQQGDRINFLVAEDLKVGGVVIIAKGATALGTVTTAKRKGMLGQGGKLAMSIDQVKAVDGQNVRLRATSGREGDDKLGKTVAIGVLAGPFALLVKGKDISAPKGTALAAYIDESKEITVTR